MTLHIATYRRKTYFDGFDLQCQKLGVDSAQRQITTHIPEIGVS